LLKRIIDLRPNETGVVTRIDGGHGLIRRLETMGVRPGVVIVKRSSQPLRGPVTIQVGGTELALGFGIAHRIIVEVGE
jgi:ferrous iron transport protein A